MTLSKSEMENVDFYECIVHDDSGRVGFNRFSTKPVVKERSILRKEVLSQEVIQLIFFLIFKFLEFLSTSNASLQSTNRPYSSFPLRALSIYVDFTESYSLHIKNNVTHVIKLIHKVKLSNSTSLILSSHIISTA